MISLWLSILLFLPIYLGVNLVAAVPGRGSLREAARVGFRRFLWGTLIIFAGTLILHLLLVWMLSRPPLW